MYPWTVCHCALLPWSLVYRPHSLPPLLLLLLLSPLLLLHLFPGLLHEATLHDGLPYPVNAGQLIFLQLSHSSLNFISPVGGTGGRQTYKLPPILIFVWKFQNKKLLIWKTNLQLMKWDSNLGLGQLSSRFEGHFPLNRKCIGVGDGLYALDAYKSVIGEDETGLLFGQNRVDVVGSLDILSEGFLLDLRKQLFGRFVFQTRLHALNAS